MVGEIGSEGDKIVLVTLQADFMISQNSQGK